ncbi:hypothetical protein ACLKA7_006193 [Drosophila subpalustris]
MWRIELSPASVRNSLRKRFRATDQFFSQSSYLMASFASIAVGGSMKQMVKCRWLLDGAGCQLVVEAPSGAWQEHKQSVVAVTVEFPSLSSAAFPEFPPRWGGVRAGVGPQSNFIVHNAIYSQKDEHYTDFVCSHVYIHFKGNLACFIGIAFGTLRFEYMLVNTLILLMLSRSGRYRLPVLQRGCGSRPIKDT